MTREEAIEIIKNYDVYSCGYCHQGGDEVEKAFDMAIEALEQESILDKIRAEIEQLPNELTTDGRRMIRRGSVFRIIDMYRAESEENNG